ncbi:MAG: hypothetical protein JWQ83_589 [Lacunisphaera sp.]|nr:hypothetical protein [Lacunisphaera sp.]
MLRTTSLRAVLSLPAALAVALLGFTGFAFADANTQRQALDLRLQRFALSEGKTAPQIAAVNTLTASADDLVYAVYELVQEAGDNPVLIADIAAGALLSPPLPQGTAAASAKVRADKDKVVGRLMEAAVVASSTSGATPTEQATIVDKVLQQLGTINNGLATTKQLTLAGKQLLVAKALRSTSGLGAAIADRVQTSGFYPITGTTAAIDTARTAFNVAVLKLLTYKPITNDPANALPTKGTYFPIRDGVQLPVRGEPAFVEGTPPSIFGVQDYIDKALDGYMTTMKQTAALNIATGVSATAPAAAGATIAGYVQDLKTNTPATSNQQIVDYLKGTTTATSIVANAKLSAAVSDIVADTLKQFNPNSGIQPGDAAVSLADSNANPGTPVAISAALKGKIASGAIRVIQTRLPAQAAATATQDVVTRILSIADGAGKAITSTGIAAFAGAAAQGNSTAGAAITTAAINKITFVPATTATPTATLAAMKADNTKIEAVAVAVGKALALVDPNAVRSVAESLFTVVRNGGNPYAVTGSAGDAARLTLSSNLAKGLGTNYAAAGAATSGVVFEQLTNNTPANTAEALVQIGNVTGAAIKAAPKAAVDIALRVASYTAITSLPKYGSTTYDQLAAAIVTNSNVASTNAGAVAAGISLADTSNTDKIVTAVIQAGTPASPAFLARQAAALTIANTVAINVDVEAIGLIARSVGGLLQSTKNLDGTTNTSKLPKLTSIGTLTTSLAKAINLKPLVSWTNRVDELGELAAELTKQYLTKAGVANSGVPDGADNNPTTALAEQKALAAGLASIGTSIFKAASAKLLADTFNNAVDVKDIAENVSGAIAQVLATSGLAGGAKDFLLTNSATGSLIALLKTAATASKSTLGVTDAFGHVAGTGSNGVYGNYSTGVSTGPNADVIRGDNSTGRYETSAKYEVGVVAGAETPIKNI